MLGVSLLNAYGQILEVAANEFGVQLRAGNTIGRYLRSAVVPTDEVNALVMGAGGDQLYGMMLCVPSGTNTVIHHACWIDVARYQRYYHPLASSGGHDADGAVSIYVEQSLQSTLDGRVAAEYAAILTLFTRFSRTRDTRLPLFLVSGFGHEIEIGTDPVGLYLRRNSDTAIFPLSEDLVEVEVLAMLQWETAALRLVVMRKGGPFTKVEQITAPTRPPPELVRWFEERRHKNVAVYERAEQLVSTVREVLETAATTIEQSGLHALFWKERESGEPESQRETAVHPILEALITQGCKTKSLSILREPLADGGHLDFLIEGTLRSGARISVCVEVKKAHAKDLLHGIMVQLPAYMHGRNSGYGFYLVLSYRCDAYPHPSSDDLGTFASLSRAAYDTGLQIWPIVVSVAPKAPPSKR